MVSAAYQPLTSWDDLGYSFYLVVRKSRNTVDGRKSCTTLDGWNPLNHGINDLTNGAGSLPPTLCLLLCHGLFCVGCNKSQLLVANIWVVYGVVQFIINSYVYIFYTSTFVLNRGPTILLRVMYHWRFRMYWMHAQAPPRIYIMQTWSINWDRTSFWTLSHNLQVLVYAGWQNRACGKHRPKW